MSFETLFYGFLNVVFFSKLKALEDFVRVSTHSVDQCVNLYLDTRQGIRKCRDRARRSFWWPGISKQIEDMVTTRPTCCKHRKNHAEPMISTPLPERPWQKVATDLFYHSGKTYIIVVDYYSRFFAIAPLKSMTTENTLNHLKSFFCRHGIPEITVSDKGPQFAAATFAKISRRMGLHPPYK